MLVRPARLALLIGSLFVAFGLAAGGPAAAAGPGDDAPAAKKGKHAQAVAKPAARHAIGRHSSQDLPTSPVPTRAAPGRAADAKAKAPQPAQAKAAQPAARATKTAAGAPAKARALTAPDNPALTTGSLAAGTPSPRLPLSADPSFSAFVQRLWPVAHAHGVTRATFESAFAGVEPDPKIAELTRKQAEFVKPIWSYLDGAASDQRIRRGQEQAQQWGSTLDAVERRYGVDRDVVLGVWGMETNFGSFTGGRDVVRSLATLAAMGYRGTFFRDELVTALLILQQGHVAREDMKGSWAGAMGQTQFMPSSFMRFAVDEDGDGHKDIWTSVPDALASTANYLRRNGWKPGLPWGFEVTAPAGFAWRTDKADFARWAASGIRRADGRPLPAHGEASLFLPAGANGPLFLVTGNFDVIKRYNNSDAYALGVAHLGDRVAGGAPIQGAWPTDDLPLARAERIELQDHLARLGYAVGERDGRLGGRTREALRDFQSRRGFVPDGYAGQSALQALRAAR